MTNECWDIRSQKYNHIPYNNQMESVCCLSLSLSLWLMKCCNTKNIRNKLNWPSSRLRHTFSHSVCGLHSTSSHSKPQQCYKSQIKREQEKKRKTETEQHVWSNANAFGLEYSINVQSIWTNTNALFFVAVVSLAVFFFSKISN